MKRKILLPGEAPPPPKKSAPQPPFDACSADTPTDYHIHADVLQLAGSFASLAQQTSATQIAFDDFHRALEKHITRKLLYDDHPVFLMGTTKLSDEEKGHHEATDSTAG